MLGDGMIVADRDLVRDGTDVIRDVAAVTSTDGGASFGGTVTIADDHWYLDACPFSGPATAVVGERLVVTWMDGRQSVHPDQDATTIWVDHSDDDGATCTTDVAVTDGGIHRWPVLAVDGETVHLVWETQASDGGLSDAPSGDGGLTSGRPVALVVNNETTGLSRTPSVAWHDGRLLVTWIDRHGGHVGWFDTPVGP